MDNEKLERYLAEMDKRNSEGEANLLVLAGELQQRGVRACGLFVTHVFNKQTTVLYDILVFPQIQFDKY